MTNFYEDDFDTRRWKRDIDRFSFYAKMLEGKTSESWLWRHLTPQMAEIQQRWPQYIRKSEVPTLEQAA